MVPFRRTRKEFVRDHVGSWYSEDESRGSRLKTIVNLMNQTARIYTVALAANNPQVSVTTPSSDNWPFAKRYEVNLNKLISDMCLDQTFRMCVLDAFFMVGIACVMMRDTDTRFHGLLESEEDCWFDPGEPWLNRISLDNAILDMSAGEWSKQRFCGHSYRADFEKVMDESAYNKKTKEKLTPTSKTSKADSDFTRNIQTGEAVDDDELKPMIWLEDIWIPENRTVATFARDFDAPPLIEREWTGSQGGPYKFLSLGMVPDNLIPSSPASQLKALHDLQNRLHRRMEADSDAHRVVNCYEPGSETDANALRTAKRNSWHKVRNPKSITRVELGGVDPREQAFSLFIQEEYNSIGGNVRMMGGLGASAGTLGQEELVQGNVSRMEADMQQSVVTFAAECIWDIGYLMWHDESMWISSSMDAANTGIHVDSSWGPASATLPDGSPARQGKFEDYGFKVEPYSMVFKTPQQKLAELYETLDKLSPLWPMFQASGASLDAEAIVEEIARLLNRPEFKRFITFASPADQLGGDQNTIRSPAVTTRNTVRRNIPTGGTPENRSAVMQQVLSGQSAPQVNSQQMASMAGAPA